MKKFLLFLVLFTKYLLGSNCNDERTVKYVAKAMSQIISDFYVKRSETFDIMIHGNSTQKLNDIVNEVMKSTKTPSRIFKPEKGIPSRNLPENLQVCKYNL
jgi:hypothetical protein